MAFYDAHKGQYEMNLSDIPRLGNPDAFNETHGTKPSRFGKP